MNANELPAEQLAQWCDEASQEYGNKPLVQVATMLRQQQEKLTKYELRHQAQRDRIAILEAQLKKGTREMNNEPVAWIGKNELQFGFTETMVTNEKESWDDIPLYTHPAKTLTDEEIAKLADDILGYQIYGYKESGVYDFARAILRKAQKK